MASACEHKLPVISLSSADVYSAYVGNKQTSLHTFLLFNFCVYALYFLGDSEAAIRRAFRIARQCAPCILFMDEIDALVTDRYIHS
jgi:AAA+ superfamily predicted ATPase